MSKYKDLVTVCHFPATDNPLNSLDWVDMGVVPYGYVDMTMAQEVLLDLDGQMPDAVLEGLAKCLQATACFIDPEPFHPPVKATVQGADVYGTPGECFSVSAAGYLIAKDGYCGWRDVTWFVELGHAVSELDHRYHICMDVYVGYGKKERFVGPAPRYGEKPKVGDEVDTIFVVSQQDLELFWKENAVLEPVLNHPFVPGEYGVEVQRVPYLSPLEK